MTSFFSAVGGPVWIAFRRLVPTAVMWSKSKPKVELQYGGRLFFDSGNSYISAADWAITTKFGLLIDVDLRKRLASSNTKPELVWSRRGRHLEIIYDVITLGTRVARFGRNLIVWCRVAPRLLWCGRSRNRKKNSNMANVCFSKPEVVISQPLIKIRRRILVCG